MMSALLACSFFTQWPLLERRDDEDCNTVRDRVVSHRLGVLHNCARDCDQLSVSVSVKLRSGAYLISAAGRR